MAYRHSTTVDGEFEAVVEDVTDRLQQEGFGVLADIDVQAAFAEKLGLDDYPRYRILGACNPSLAKEGLDAEPDLGVLLPCNVVVREQRGGDSDVVVSAVDAETMLDPVDSGVTDRIAADANERFERVLDGL